MLVMKVIKMNDGGRLVEMEVIKGFSSGRGDGDWVVVLMMQEEVVVVLLLLLLVEMYCVYVQVRQMCCQHTHTHPHAFTVN